MKQITRSLIEALQEMGLLPSRELADEACEAVISQILSFWREHGCWSGYDRENLGILVESVAWDFSPEFFARHGPVFGPRLPRKYLPRLFIGLPRPGEAIEWEFCAGHIYERWSLPWNQGWSLNQAQLLDWGD